MNIQDALEASEERDGNSENYKILYRKYKTLRKRVLKQNKKIKCLNQKIRRRNKKISNVNELLRHLKEHNMIDQELDEALQKISGPVREIIQRHLLKQRGKKLPQTYNAKLRAFALTLNFLSPKAYLYVRENFGGLLPHDRTIRKWYESIDCQPGFTKESFAALKKAVDLARESGEKLFVNLVFDEMHIRQEINWNGKKSYGFVDIGDGGEIGVVATQIIVFMAVCINRPWKIPVAIP